MRKSEWQKAFGDTPASFQNSVSQALSRLESRRKVRRRSVKVAAIVAAAAITLSGTALALARHWSSLDYLNGGQQPQTLPEATALLEDLSSTPSASTARVKYSAQDMVYDGNQLVVTFVAEPLQENTLLIGADEGPEGRRAENGDSLTESADQQSEGVTLESLSKDYQLVQVNMPSLIVDGADADALGLENNGVRAGNYFSMDGKLYYSVQMRLESDQPLDITCEFNDAQVSDIVEDQPSDPEIPVLREFVTESSEQASLRLTVKPQKEILSRAHFDGPMECEYMTIDSVDIERTALATYLTLEYTVKDNLTPEQLAEVDIISFNLMNSPDSTEFSSGLGGYTTQDGENHYISYHELTAMSEMPETLYLRPFYKESGTWGNAIELKLSDAKTE